MDLLYLDLMKKMRHFTLEKIFSRNSRTALPAQPVLSSSEAYLNCAELPLKLWLKITLTKDLKYLVKAGEFSIERLVEIWTAINDEYRELILDVDSNYQFDLMKETTIDDKKLLHITAIVNQLRIRRNEELILILKKDFEFRFNYVDLSRDLDLTLKQVKFRAIQLKLKNNEYITLATSTNKKAFTEYDFIEQLDVISESRGYHLNIETLTVLEYIAIYNRFKRDVENKLRNA